LATLPESKYDGAHDCSETKFLEQDPDVCKQETGFSFIRCSLRVITPRRMRWKEYEASMEEMRNRYNILVGTPDTKTKTKMGNIILQ
jgi:hypothetical protein